MGPKFRRLKMQSWENVIMFRAGKGSLKNDITDFFLKKKIN